MDKVVRNAIDSFGRVQDFLAQHPLSDAPATLGAQATELDDVMARLSSDSLDQEAGDRFVRAHSESQRKLRSTLYTDHMHPISRVAREVFGTTGMDKAFRMPRPGAANQKLIASAGAMAEVAEKDKDVLLKHGLPQDFIEQLKSAASSLADARNAKVESARRRITATAALEDQVKRGKKAVRLLNAILQPRLAKDPELLAAWRSAKRVPPSGGATAVGSAPVAPVVAPSPSPSATEKAA